MLRVGVSHCERKKARAVNAHFVNADPAGDIASLGRLLLDLI
jgi:hypothetical protein